jgi:hypothetical protein
MGDGLSFLKKTEFENFDNPFGCFKREDARNMVPKWVEFN